MTLNWQTLLKIRGFNMSSFSQRRDFNVVSVVTASYPPLVRNIGIKGGVTGLKIGQVVIVKTTGVEPWNGTDAGRLAITTESQRNGALSLPCLVIGTYKGSIVKVGDILINESQKLMLMNSNLFND